MGLNEVCDLFSGTPQNGIYKSSTEYGSGTKIIRIDGFYDGRILDDYDYKRVRLNLDEIKKYKISIGDILVNRVNSMSHLGKCGLVRHLNEDTVFESNIMRIQVNEQYATPEYVSIYLSSKKGLSELTKNAKQAVNQASINQTDVSNALIPLPPVEEQNQIIQEIESRLSVCDKAEETITQSLQQAETLRQSILKKAFEGKLVKQKAEVPKRKNIYFYQVQLLAYLIHYSNLKGIHHGEMTAAKYAYLLHKIYGINTYYNFKRWHLGPYAPEMKAAIKKKEFFAIENNKLTLVNPDKILKYSNPVKEQVEKAINELTQIIEILPGKNRAHKTELFATVCKIIEDIQSTDLQAIRSSMLAWEIDLATSHFKNKAEKFGEKETRECLEIIIEISWDKRILKY